MKINKSTIFLWATVGILTVAIAIVMISGKEEKPSKVTQANQSTTSQQQATHQEQPSTQQPQQKQQDSSTNTKSLETAGIKTDGISSAENEEIEQVKKITLELLHTFDEKNISGLEAEKAQNDLYEKIKSMFTKEAQKQYSIQDIAKYYENLGLYSFIGKGEQSMMDMKLKEVQVKNVVFSKEYNAYMMGIQVATKQNKMIIGLGLQKEDGKYKFMHIPDSKVVQLK
ncbi:hypothetical protein [Bacillus cereus]|uniref:Uncharacterized protein n=1 Tax=Bacillus cereus TaxID=1396 RepID=A0A2B9DRT0_BACCE|nr:hypothetical protein [Bacillus cereus]PGM89729.1 hypothetical protein CN958_23400 [Bacillus cereus]